MAVAYEVNPFEREQPGMKHRFDAGFLAFAFHACVQQRLIDGFILDRPLIQNLQNFRGVSDSNVGLRQCGEAAAGCFYGEVSRVNSCRSVPFAEDRQVSILPTQRA